MPDQAADETQVRIRLLGGPTLVIEFAGLRLLTDPTFDGPGEYDTGRGYNLVKTQGPALRADEVGPIDVVLLSHDQHADNLDTECRTVSNRPCSLIHVSVRVYVPPLMSGCLPRDGRPRPRRPGQPRRSRRAAGFDAEPARR